MEPKRTDLVLTISPLQDSDEQELAQLGQQLRAAVLESEADSIEPIQGGAPPGGAKGEPLTLAALAIAIAPKAVEGLIQIIQNWLSRHERATVTMKSGDLELTIMGRPSVEQQRLTKAFLTRVRR